MFAIFRLRDNKINIEMSTDDVSFEGSYQIAESYQGDHEDPIMQAVEHFFEFIFSLYPEYKDSLCFCYSPNALISKTWTKFIPNTRWIKNTNMTFEKWKTRDSVIDTMLTMRSGTETARINTKSSLKKLPKELARLVCDFLFI